MCVRRLSARGNFGLEYEAMPLTIDPAPTEDRVLEVGAPKGPSGHDERVSDESLPG